MAAILVVGVIAYLIIRLIHNDSEDGSIATYDVDDPENARPYEPPLLIGQWVPPHTAVDGFVNTTDDFQWRP